jgi:hypothetical protein
VRLTARLLALGLAALLGACVPSVARVEKGEVVETGETDYDAFFQDVHDVSKQAENGESDLRDTKARLTEALGAADEAALVEAASKRAETLKGEGVLLHLALTPEPKLVVTGGAEKPAALRAVERAAKEALLLVKSAEELASRTAALEATRRELSGRASSAFGKDAKMASGDVLRELTAAANVLEKAASSGERVAGASAKLALDLARALETGAAVAEARPPEQAKKPRWSGGGRAPAGGGAAKPAAPKKPKPADDFEP